MQIPGVYASVAQKESSLFLDAQQDGDARNVHSDECLLSRSSLHDRRIVQLHDARRKARSSPDRVDTSG